LYEIEKKCISLLVMLNQDTNSANFLVIIYLEKKLEKYLNINILCSMNK